MQRLAVKQIDILGIISYKVDLSFNQDNLIGCKTFRSVKQSHYFTHSQTVVTTVVI